MLLIASGFANICECFLPLTRWPEIIKSSQPSLSIALFFLRLIVLINPILTATPHICCSQRLHQRIKNFLFTSELAVDNLEFLAE